MATHPVIMEVSRKLLGDKCRLSSLSANSVLPGMEGQDPHLDYPYYRHLWPSKEGCMDLPATHMLCLQVCFWLRQELKESLSVRHKLV